MPTVALYSPVDDERLFSIIRFYANDIDSLRAEGFRVEACRSFDEVIRSNPSVVLAWWWHRSARLAMWARRSKVPLILTGATDFRMPEQAFFRRLARIGLTGLVGQLANVNLAISEYEFADLARVRARNRRVLYLSVDTKRYRSTRYVDRSGAAIVAQMNPHSIRRKGVHVAIKSALAVAATLPDFRLHLIGPETREGASELDTLLHRDVDGVIIRHGSLTEADKIDVLSQVRFYLQPSGYEGFGLAVLEAMSCGCIPLVSGESALPEVVGQSGNFVSSPTVSAMTELLLEKVSQSEADLVEMSRGARERALIFSNEVRGQALANEVSAVLGLKAVESRPQVSTSPDLA